MVRVKSGARSLGSLLLGCSLLAAACQLPVLRPPAVPAPPEREFTICERPARPAAAAQDPKVEASFRAFARTWLEMSAAVTAAMLLPRLAWTALHARAPSASEPPQPARAV